MNKKVMQFTALIGQQIMEMFDEESVNYVDIDNLGEDATAFIYAMTVCAPAMIYSKLTGDSKNFLEFNHMSNQLCFQFMKEETERKDGVINSKVIVSNIISDLKGRKGIGNEFQQIDDEIQAEIIDTWINIVESDGQTASN